MIPQRNLSLLSNRLAERGGRRIPENVLERDYCIAWFLVGLSRSPLREELAFKGGTALKRCYFGNYRFSEDLDFTLLKGAPFERIVSELEPIFGEVRRTSGVTFAYAREDRQAHENSYTFYLSHDGPLPSTGGKEIKCNITIRERVVFPLAYRPVLRAYDEYTDLPEDALVQAYTLEEIATEKIVAVTDPVRNEPRDLYDLWFLCEGGHVVVAQLESALQEKLAFRGRAGARLGEELAGKEARLKRLWGRRLSAHVADLPQYEAVFRAVERHLRQAGLTAR